MIPPPLLLPVAFGGSLAAAAATRPLLRLPLFSATNWRGLTIPRGYGISFPLAQTVAVAVWWILRQAVAPLTLPALALWAMAGAGLMDDLSADPSGGGFRRHLQALFREGRLSAGLLKALLGGVICLAVGFLPGGWGGTRAALTVGLLNGLLLALFSNTINLLDVRPGRAAKVAFAGYLVALVAVTGAAVGYLPVLLAAALFFLADCRGRVMLGDVGAYPLGFTLGMAFLSLSLPLKAALCCILGGFHLYCELGSVTRVIERNRILKWLDKLWVTN